MPNLKPIAKAPEAASLAKKVSTRRRYPLIEPGQQKAAAGGGKEMGGAEKIMAEMTGERSAHIRKYKGLPQEEVMSSEMLFLQARHLHQLMDLQELVAQSLPSAEILRLHSTEFFAKALRSERSGLGIFTKEGLVAFGLICIPPPEGNLGSDLGLGEEELRRTAHLQVVAVHPAYRGNSLQRLMVARHQQVLAEMGYEHVCSTVSPFNPFSLRNLLHEGFVINALKVKFGSQWRYIMYKNLRLATAVGPEEAAVSLSDIETQLELLERGLLGFGLKSGPAGLQVSYARPVRQ
jgi:ribosomal protein S18 acetylase RimI-like enzyme